MNKQRITEVFINNKWIKIEFENIKKGQLVRLFENDGTVVKYKEDETEFEAISDAYINNNKIWSFVMK